MEDGFEEGVCGGLSSTFVYSSLSGGESFLCICVVVGEGWVSRLFGSEDEGFVERIFVFCAGYAEFSFCATKLRSGGSVGRGGFYFLEVWEDMGAAPIFCAEFFPCIEVLGISSDEDHAVDGGGSSDNFSSGASELSII